jgi:hypothetical protein
VKTRTLSPSGLRAGAPAGDAHAQRLGNPRAIRPGGGLAPVLHTTITDSERLGTPLGPSAYSRRGVLCHPYRTLPPPKEEGLRPHRPYQEEGLGRPHRLAFKRRACGFRPGPRLPPGSARPRRRQPFGYAGRVGALRLLHVHELVASSRMQPRVAVALRRTACDTDRGDTDTSRLMKGDLSKATGDAQDVCTKV